MTKTSFRLLCFSIFLLAFSPTKSQGTLGGSVDSVESDQKSLLGSSKAIDNHSLYSIHEFKTDSASIREFVSSTGVVFAFTWVGISSPDLAPLLGSYHSDYKAALKKTPPKHGVRSRVIKGEKVVVEHWGHQRRLQGRAYDPALIPTGVTLNEIK